MTTDACKQLTDHTRDAYVSQEQTKTDYINGIICFDLHLKVVLEAILEADCGP